MWNREHVGKERASPHEKHELPPSAVTQPSETGQPPPILAGAALHRPVRDRQQDSSSEKQPHAVGENLEQGFPVKTGRDRRRPLGDDSPGLDKGVKERSVVPPYPNEIWANGERSPGEQKRQAPNLLRGKNGVQGEVDEKKK